MSAALKPQNDPLITLEAVAAAIIALQNEVKERLDLTDDWHGHFWWTADGEPMCEPTDLAGVLASVNAWRSRLINEKAVELLSGASPTKSRGRPLDRVVGDRRDQLVELARGSQPSTVRGLYYLAETRGLVSKDDNGYRRVQHDILLLRRGGRIPHDWISDHTRWMRKSRSYCGIEHFLNLTISTYRRDLWASSPVHVEVWCEKDALAGVLIDVTDSYDVPLLIARGCSSDTFLFENAQALKANGKPAYIYAFFDHDPSGKVAAAHIERKLREYAPGVPIHFQLAAVTEAQIEAWNLPTRPTKREGNRHAKNFHGDSCELDAIPPPQLRDLVRDCIEQHVDRDRLAAVQVAEESEREALTMFAQSWRAGA